MNKNDKTFVIYRSNDLFDTYVPQLIEGINVVGTFVIPRGTEFTSVRATAVTAAKQAWENGARTIITDGTCLDANSIYREGEEGPIGRIFQDLVHLDYQFQGAINNMFPENSVAENIDWFAKQIAKNRTVSLIVIVKSKLADHGWAGGNKPAWNEEERSQWLAEQLGMIFPDCTVGVVETLQEALEFSSDSEALLVLDRHCGVKKIMAENNGWYNSLANWPHASMLFLLPLETTAANLISRGNADIDFDIEAMRRNLIRS